MEVRITEPFPDYALPRVWHWIQSFRWRVADDFAPQNLPQFMEHWEAHRQSRRSWAVLRGDEIGGLVTVDPMSHIAVSSNCTFKRSFWASDAPVPALVQVYGEVFRSAPDISKIVTWAFADNAQLLGLMRKVGAEKEGVLRKQTRRKGEPVDMIAIGLLREDFEKRNGL